MDIFKEIITGLQEAIEFLERNRNLKTKVIKTASPAPLMPKRPTEDLKKTKARGKTVT